MPIGCFTVLLPKDIDYKVLGYYFKQKGLDFKITSDLFLRLNLDHSKNEYTLLKLKNYTLVSYIHKFIGKISRKASGIIFGLLLNEEDDAEKFRISLKNCALIIEDLNFLEMSNNDFEAKLKEIYQKNLETLKDVLDANVLKDSIINRTKEMLSGDKKERKKAQELLDKIEDKLHTKIPDYYKTAEDALEKEDYDKAKKFFNKAAEVADELLENELAKSLMERANLSINIPNLTKNLNEVVQKARNALKKEDFHNSYIFYLKASELSKELMLGEKEEEYRLKSKALQDFYQVDQRFKKKK